jgi:hypothetical protein
MRIIDQKKEQENDAGIIKRSQRISNKKWGGSRVSMDAKDGLLRVRRASVCYPSNCAGTARGRRVYGMRGVGVGVVGERKRVVKLVMRHAMRS